MFSGEKTLNMLFIAKILKSASDLNTKGALLCFKACLLLSLSPENCHLICSPLDSVVWQPDHKVSVQAMDILQGEWLCLVTKLLINTEMQGEKVKDTFPF